MCGLLRRLGRAGRSHAWVPDASVRRCRATGRATPEAGSCIHKPDTMTPKTSHYEQPRRLHCNATGVWSVQPFKTDAAPFPRGKYLCTSPSCNGNAATQRCSHDNDAATQRPLRPVPASTASKMANMKRKTRRGAPKITPSRCLANKTTFFTSTPRSYHEGTHRRMLTMSQMALD